MGELRVDDWKWNVWQVDPKTKKLKKWLGQISNPKDGFAWLAKQGKKRDQFRINNVPPLTSRMQNPPFEVYATDDTTLVRGKDLAPLSIPGKYENYVPRDRRTKAAPVVTGKPMPTATKSRPVVAVQKPKTKEQKKLEADAKVLLDQHKADEQAEMDAAKNDDA